MAIFATIRALIAGNIKEWIARAGIVIVLAAILFVALGGISHRPWWHIDTIRVDGAVIVSRDDIRTFVQQEVQGNYFFSYARDNSYLFPKKEIERVLLEKFPRLKTALAWRVDAHTIAISVSERKPYALWCQDERLLDQAESPTCWFLDDQGFVFDVAPTMSEGVYLEVYGTLDGKVGDSPIGAVVPRARFEHTDSFARILRDEVGVPQRIILKDGDEFDILMQSSKTYLALAGAVLRLKDDMKADETVRSLRAAMGEEFPGGVPLKKKLLYVDLRFGNKIFFGF